MLVLVFTGTEGTFIIDDLKMEIGTKYTDWSPAPEDIDASIAKTVKQVDVEYYLSTSSTSVTGGSWVTTAPTWVDGKYMWSRQKVTYVDGTTATRNQTCIAGAKGATGSPGGTGATGTGVESITEEYYLSTSKSSQTGGSWSTTPPTWSSGKYIWTRSKIVYKNPASTTYTTPLCSSEWEAINEIDIGGRNLITIIDNLNNTSKDITISTNLYSGINFTEYGIENCKENDMLYMSFEAKASTPLFIDMYFRNKENDTNYMQSGEYYPGFELSTEYQKFVYYNTLKRDIAEMSKYMRFRQSNTMHGSSGNYGTIYIKNLKIEKGNKPTDWTPAPEDIDKNIETVSAYAQNVANELLTAKGQLTAATTRIDSLQGIIENFVKDDNGMVTVTQTGSGMQIDMTQATNRINQLLTAIESAVTELEADQLRTELLAAIQAVQSRTAYINATQDAQGRPVITLGATDSPFKVEITNEAINFIQNGQVIAYANGQKFYNLRTVVQQDVQIGIGPGFIWKTRDSGNMGLTWVPAQS